MRPCGERVVFCGKQKIKKLKLMKTKLLLVAALIGAASLSAHAGVRFGFSFGLPLPGPIVLTAPVAPVVVATPPPAVEVAPPVVEVPESYVWDGVEFVGVVGGAYFYLGPGDFWLACDPVHLERFRGWERYHSDWRAHAIRNDRFRNDAHGHVAPMRNEHNGHVQPGHGQPQKVAPKSGKNGHH